MCMMVMMLPQAIPAISAAKSMMSPLRYSSMDCNRSVPAANPLPVRNTTADIARSLNNPLPEGRKAEWARIGNGKNMMKCAALSEGIPNMSNPAGRVLSVFMKHIKATAATYAQRIINDMCFLFSMSFLPYSDCMSLSFL